MGFLIGIIIFLFLIFISYIVPFAILTLIFSFGVVLIIYLFMFLKNKRKNNQVNIVEKELNNDGVELIEYKEKNEDNITYNNIKEKPLEYMGACVNFNGNINVINENTKDNVINIILSEINNNENLFYLTINHRDLEVNKIESNDILVDTSIKIEAIYSGLISEKGELIPWLKELKSLTIIEEKQLIQPTEYSLDKKVEKTKIKSMDEIKFNEYTTLRIKHLKKMLSKKFITQQEFDSQINKILNDTDNYI